MNPSALTTAATLPAPPCVALSPLSDQSGWFEAEVLPLDGMLRTYLRGKFPNLGDIDDVLQETYTRTLRARQAKGEIADIRPYLFVTARNAAIDYFRRAHGNMMQPLTELESLSVVEEAPDAAERTAHDQELSLLHQAIDALPLKRREVFILCKLQKLSHREAAEKLGVSENTVEGYLARGMIQCRAFLKLHGLPAK
ncbi:MAG: polymerase, sigma-24 subunit, subfamily [Verrucomicrobia bacterium]|nr:polymerase, sigma-24 subunit, subfamily [Verrucomicrobiota bacterium]